MPVVYGRCRTGGGRNSRRRNEKYARPTAHCVFEVFHDLSLTHPSLFYRILANDSRDSLDRYTYRTTYEASSKQHWLCVYKGKLVGRFLLKDTSKQDTSMARPKSFAEMMQTDTKIRQVVDEMVRKVSSP